MKKFEINKTYSTRSICDYNCIFSFEITKRTDKNVWIKEDEDTIVKRKIYQNDTTEYIYPLGKYSMCPTIAAE